MIAEVIVDISNPEVDRIFDYALPDSRVDLGGRVAVPFGPREIEGFVIAFKDTSDCPPEKMKSILRQIDDFPVISGEMLLLAAEMREKYHLRMVDVLRLFLPGEMRSGKVKPLVRRFAFISAQYLNRSADEFIKARSVNQRDLFFYLQENGESPVTFLNAAFSAASLKNLVTRGIVEIRESEVKRTPYAESVNRADKIVELTSAQRIAVDRLTQYSAKPSLLHGVTGSGKTEVYMHCILKALSKGQTAIMLVPEISLTPQVLKNFRLRFGERVALLHSGLTAGERFDEWRRLLTGEAVVAVGARSAVFAPLTNLGVIIIDEEHDSSYVAESNPRYVTAEVAAKRASLNGCNLILGSATPSVETYHKTETGEYHKIELPDRVNRKPLPEIRIVNMCDEIYAGNNGVFSRLLKTDLEECMHSGNQAIIFINRRGYSSYMMCRSCGYVAKCNQCDVSLVYHREENILKCHYCGNRFSALDLCPECKSPHIKQGYLGTERVENELKQMFPDKTVLRMDNDTTQGKDAHLKILTQFAEKRADILVGTQMIAKGHDFPDVTLVGIVDADMSLHFADYRSSERTYQLITQVSGRAGRDSKPGKVVLQTYSPNHYVYKFAVKNDYKGFYDKEINLREVTKYPPFSRIIRILVSGESEEAVSRVLKNLFDKIDAYAKTDREAFQYFAAMKSPVKLIKGKYRMQILMRIAQREDEVTKNIYALADGSNLPKVSVFIEINPNNLS